MGEGAPLPSVYFDSGAHLGPRWLFNPLVVLRRFSSRTLYGTPLVGIPALFCLWRAHQLHERDRRFGNSKSDAPVETHQKLGARSGFPGDYNEWTTAADEL